MANYFKTVFCHCLLLVLEEDCIDVLMNSPAIKLILNETFLYSLDLKEYQYGKIY